MPCEARQGTARTIMIGAVYPPAGLICHRFKIEAGEVINTAFEGPVEGVDDEQYPSMRDWHSLFQRLLTA